MAAAKKRNKRNGKKKETEFDLEYMLGEIRSRVDVLSEKTDSLLSKSAAVLRIVSTESDPGFKTQATVNKKFSIPQDNYPRERKMHQAVCAQCKAACEVPFVPRPDRPVYCKACYSSRRSDNNSRNLPNRDEIVAEIAKTLNIDMPLTGVGERPEAKTTKPRAKKRLSSPKTKAEKPKAKGSSPSKTKTVKPKIKGSLSAKRRSGKSRTGR